LFAAFSDGPFVHSYLGFRRSGFTLGFIVCGVPPHDQVAVINERQRITMNTDFIQQYRDDALASFRNYKKLAERAMEQVSDEEFFSLIDDEANSIALIVKHIAGNLRSRWTDFLTTDGEKADRNRDAEFEVIEDTRNALIDAWENGWQSLFNAIEPLTPADFSKTVTIRGEAHTIVEAINRQLTHYAYHIGQIVLLAKHFKSVDWKTLSVPKNRSAEFNKFVSEKKTSGKGLAGGMEFGDSE
jgi:hypothetical protein